MHVLQVLLQLFCYKTYDTHSHDILSFSVHVHSILIYLLKDGSEILGECDSNSVYAKRTSDYKFISWETIRAFISCTIHHLIGHVIHVLHMYMWMKLDIRLPWNWGYVIASLLECPEKYFSRSAVKDKRKISLKWRSRGRKFRNF